MPSPESELLPPFWPAQPSGELAEWSSSLAGEEDKEDMSSGASCAPSGGRSPLSLKPMIEEMRKGLTAAEDWEPGDPLGVLREAWVAATLDFKRLRRPLEATTCDAMTSAGEASTMAAVSAAGKPEIFKEKQS